MLRFREMERNSNNHHPDGGAGHACRGRDGGGNRGGGQGVGPTRVESIGVLGNGGYGMELGLRSAALLNEVHPDPRNKMFFV